MIRDITVPAKRCECDKCGHVWISVGKQPPQNCQNKQCRSREWNGKKKRSRVHEIKLPTPRKAGRPRVTKVVGDEF